MTACPPRCGVCCDPVVLSFDPATLPDLAAAPGAHPNTIANAAWAAEHWTLRSYGVDPADPDTVRVWRMTCDAFDPVTRACTAYDARPPVCSNFPWYGRPPDPTRPIDLVCAYHDDVPGRRVLPLTVLRSAR